MEVGVVRIAEDNDFCRLRQLVDRHEGWRLDYNKPDIRVWTRPSEAEGPVRPFKLVKVLAVLGQVRPDTLYDVLHDPDYRREWDSHMICSQDIGFLNINNDVGYYSMSCPSPLKNRDFVLQRSWLDTGEEQMILNHSVYHKDYPPRKGFVRAISHLTGFVVRAAAGGGSSLGYVSQTDPAGRLPAWLVNSVTQGLAPKLAKRLERAARAYPAWKSTCPQPDLMPWRNPEQIPTNRISILDCVDTSHGGSKEAVPDESMVKEKDVKKKRFRRFSESD